MWPQVSCVSHNFYFTEVAISVNNRIEVFKHDCDEWDLLDVLDKHDLRVTGVDWSPISNRIVSCAADRNAYVWTQDRNGKWKHTQVHLRINHGATCVKWSPHGNKFAVGSGSKIISVCYSNEISDWWEAMHIKKSIRSTVTSVDWHPNNILLACGSTDYKARIFCAYIKDIEETAESTAWGDKIQFGQLVAQFVHGTDCGGWVHNVSFSPDGNKLCWVSHDSTVNLAEATKGNVAVKFKTKYLPFLSCKWISNVCIAVAGHDCKLVFYEINDDGKLVEKECSLNLNNPVKLNDEKNLSAMKKFQMWDKQGTENVQIGRLDSEHQKAVTTICVHSKNESGVSKISSSGLDGRLIIWDLNCPK